MLTERQRKCLEIVASGRGGLYLTADDVAARLGYRPARRGRLAVVKTLRSMLPPGSDVGDYLVRLAPRDQWCATYWAVTDAGRALVTPGQTAPDSK